jgi:hypothetical protein
MADAANPAIPKAPAARNRSRRGSNPEFIRFLRLDRVLKPNHRNILRYSTNLLR